jgi:hypothetical protein
MCPATIVTYVISFGLVLLVVLLGIAGYRWGRGGRLTPVRPLVSGGRQEGQRNDPRGEHLASPAAEVLESIIQRRMAADPALAGQRLDFGTSQDGSIEIWWNGEAYTGVDQVPDARVRDLIAQATDEFNRGGGVSG